MPLGYRVMGFDLLPGGAAWVKAEDCGSDPCRSATLFTADAGRSWTRFDLGGVEPYALAFADRNHGWLSTWTCHLYATEDGGHTWRQLR